MRWHADCAMRCSGTSNWKALDSLSDCFIFLREKTKVRLEEPSTDFGFMRENPDQLFRARAIRKTYFSAPARLRRFRRFLHAPPAIFMHMTAPHRFTRNPYTTSPTWLPPNLVGGTLPTNNNLPQPPHACVLSQMQCGDGPWRVGLATGNVGPRSASYFKC